MGKSQISDLTIPILVFIDGLICILTARYAFEIGLDPDETWGRTRFILLTLGAILLLASSLMIFLKYRNVHLVPSFLMSEKSKILIILFHLWAVIFLIYGWFITYGTFTKWDHTSNYYSQLADAFNNRQLYLDVKPSKAILATPDPYNPENRPRQEEIWDMSLYKGRIYLYWGPLPALLIAPVQRLSSVKILDIYTDFFFYAGLLIVNSMILLKLRKDFFPNITIWNVFVCIALIGLIAPVLWALIPTTIYGTAIGAGHFFLMGGIYFILTAFDQEPSVNSKRLFLAGLFWICSIGSRALNTPSIMFLAILAAIWIARITPRPFHWTKYLQTITPLFIPLVFGAIATGWYNWARFDSPFEFGLRYQITFFNLNRDLGLTIQPDYFLPNLYVYLLQPFRLITNFPFATPIYTPELLARHNMVFPKMFFAGRMTGLLYCSPFLLVGLVHFFIKKPIVTEEKAGRLNLIYDFVLYSLVGSFLMGFLGLMFFFFGQMRYLVDVISQAAILAILGYWRLISVRQNMNSILSKLVVTISNFLLVLTICIGLLLAITSETSRMAKLNPVLLDKITESLSFEK
jgi:hypothetical protein